MDKTKGSKRKGKRVAQKPAKVEDKLLSIPLRDNELGASPLPPPGPFGYQGPSTSGLKEIKILQSNLDGLLRVRQQESASSEEWKSRMDRQLWIDVISETIVKGEIEHLIPEIAGKLEKSCFDGSISEDEYISKVNDLCSEIQSMGWINAFKLIRNTKVSLTPEQAYRELPTFVVPGSPFSQFLTKNGEMMSQAACKLKENSPGLVLNQNHVESFMVVNKASRCGLTQANGTPIAKTQVDFSSIEGRSPQHQDEGGDKACSNKPM